MLFFGEGYSSLPVFFQLSHSVLKTGKKGCCISEGPLSVVERGETMTLKWVMVLGVGLLMAQVNAEQTPILKTEKDMVSYVIGSRPRRAGN